MSAEEFFRKRKQGRKLENEYFIAMDKASFFKLMEAYASHKKNEMKGKHIDRTLVSATTSTKVNNYM
jgi:hypothetical protein